MFYLTRDKGRVGEDVKTGESVRRVMETWGDRSKYFTSQSESIQNYGIRLRKKICREVSFDD